MRPRGQKDIYKKNGSSIEISNGFQLLFCKWFQSTWAASRIGKRHLYMYMTIHIDICPQVIFQKLIQFLRVCTIVILLNILSLWESLSPIFIIIILNADLIGDFLWSLCDSKSPQVSRTLLSILVYLKKVWMVLILPLIYAITSHVSRHLLIIPSTPTPNGMPRNLSRH